MATNFSDKNISSIQLKDIKYNLKSVFFHGTEAEWLEQIEYIPKQGEIIIYDIEEGHSYPRIKIGDGVTNVGGLSFYGNEFALISDVQSFEESISEAVAQKSQVQIVTWEADD